MEYNEKTFWLGVGGSLIVGALMGVVIGMMLGVMQAQNDHSENFNNQLFVCTYHIDDTTIYTNNPAYVCSREANIRYLFEPTANNETGVLLF